MEPNFDRIANGLRHILDMFAYDERIPEGVFTNDDVDVLCDAEAIVRIVKQESENESKDDFSRGQWKDRLKKRLCTTPLVKPHNPFE